MTDIPYRPEGQLLPGAPVATPESYPKLSENEGLLSWVASVDHKLIGVMYLIGAFFFLAVGGIEALVMRIQLGTPRSTFLSPDVYNQVFTMHGTTMIFFAAIPMLSGFMNYFIPLMIGARDVAYPRLNALGFWLFIFGALLTYFSFVAGGAPNDGWFSYAPYSEKPWSTTPGIDYYCLGLLVVGIGTVATGINIIVTVITMRAPGLTLLRLPLFVWMSMLQSFLVVFAIPALNAALVMTLIDRQFNAHFFSPAINNTGGSPVLYQHIFWTFGHPEVYIAILPVFGMISEVIPVFSRKAIFGYGFVAGSTAAIAFLSFGVWAHHMFAVGMDNSLNLAFGLGTMIIAVPTGVKVFNWCATMYGGRLHLTTSMLFAIGFLINFTIGGITGVTFGAFPVDWQVTASYYVVAHFHYVFFGGTLLGLYAATYYWFPKITGKLLDETLGKWHFWLTMLGLTMTFFIQHVLGMMGMPRRVYTYPDFPNWGLFNLISTIGAFVTAASVLVFFWNVYVSMRRGKPAGDNPWRAWTLEWATTSPPPAYNFDQLPIVRSRRPLWDEQHPEDPDWKRSASQGGTRPVRNVMSEDDTKEQEEAGGQK